MIFFEDVMVGDKLPTLECYPSNVGLFRFSAVTWNPHRIHYDRTYAISEGYPNVLVQSHLHGCYLSRAALAWTRGSGVLRRFRWENRHYALPGDVLRCDGSVRDSYEDGDGIGLVDLELVEVNQEGVLCAPAWATVQLRRRHESMGPSTR